MTNVFFFFSLILFFKDELPMNDINEDVNALEYQEEEDTGTFQDQTVDL